MTARRALITGVSGQDGSYLSELLLQKGYEVHGFARRGTRTQDERVRLHVGDLSDAAALRIVLHEVRPDEVYNLGAQSHVHASFYEPEYTFRVTALPIITVLDFVRNHSPETRVYQASCYDEQTRVLTADGLKKYDEVRVGDMVLTTNVETNQLEVKRVKRIIVEEYSGEMIRFSGRRIDLLVTPNHQMLFHGDTGLFYTEAGVLSFPEGERIAPRGSTIKFPNPNWSGLQSSTMKLSQISPCEIPCNAYKNLIDEIETDDLFWITGLYIGDGFTSPDRHVMRSGPKEEFIALRDEHGHFIAQEKTEPVTYRGYNIYFAIPLADKSRDRLIAWCKKYNIDHRTSPDWVRFSSYPLAHFLKTCGTSAYEKKIPDWMLSYARPHLQALFEGLIGSDGHAKPNGKSFSYVTVSKQLVPGVVELGIKLGLRCSTAQQPESDRLFIREHRVIHSRGAYTIHISDNHEERPITLYPKHVSRGLYNGKVWCLEVEDNHNFVVERNGRYAFCGNSSEMFGTELPPQNEETPFAPRSPYAVAKVAAHQSVRLWREAYGVFAVGGILFNHESERRPTTFVTRKISRGVARVVLGFDKELVLGNLEAQRDWGYAPDYVEAMWRMLQGTRPRDYVVATGETHTVRDFVVLAFRFAEEITGKMLDWERYVRVDASFKRPAEVPALCGDATRALADLGWQPSVRFRELVRRMVSSDLDQLTRSRPSSA